MGGPALCVVIGLVALLDLGFLSVLVLPTQGWLLFRRLRKSRQWLTSKTAIFYGIVFENIAMLLHCLMWRHITPVLHLVFDYSQFLLFTCVFYYFTLHTFQIMGRIVAIRATLYFLTVANVLYLSGFTLYISIEMVADEVQSYCKSTLSLSARVAFHAVQCLRTESATHRCGPVRFPLLEPQVRHCEQAKSKETVGSYCHYPSVHFPAARVRLVRNCSPSELLLPRSAIDDSHAVAVQNDECSYVATRQTAM